MSFNQPGAFSAPETDGGLRHLTWHDLCSRIVAMQDLRRAMGAASVDNEAGFTGSFHGKAAQIIATGFSGVLSQASENECLVNPVSSANCKTPLGTTIDTEGRFAAGPR